MVGWRRYAQALIGLVGLMACPAMGASFTVRDIELEGLEHLEPGTVFTYLPVEVGEELDEGQSARIIRALYQTGLFSDIRLSRRGDILIVQVAERPVIGEISFDGNKDIPDEALTEALKSVDIATGRVFNRSVLKRLESELLQQYYARGKYNVRIDTTVTELERNRVGIDINIREGEVARIKRINIVGNQTFTEDDLKDDFESGIPSWYAFFSDRDQYSKQKLAGDLERLRSHYLDQGFLKFNIASTQVAITPDKEDIFITLNIDEGERYTISAVDLAGDFVVPKAQLKKLVKVKSGDTFSRAQAVATVDAINQKLGDAGYAFAEINPVPEIDERKKAVKLTFFIDPGPRVYVRRINFIGNESTQDIVFRREMRQFEGAWYSLSDIERSRLRIQRLPYVESVTIDTQRVPGADNLVDLGITVKERLAGNFAIGVGYAQTQGLLFNLSLTQDNFLGLGRRVALRFDNSDFNTVYSFAYTNPYYTLDGISRGFQVSYSETDAGEANISDFDATQFESSITYGIPLTEFDTLRPTFGYERVSIGTNDRTPDEILDFLASNGRKFDILPISSSLVHDTRDRTVFADRGNLQTLSLELAVPGGDLEYYKTELASLFYVPITEGLTFSLSGEVAYGKSYGKTSDLPFFEKYFAGGFRTVRGYELNSLGPRDSFNQPFGGNFRVISQTELLFPVPFIENSNSIRLSTFFDAGNVFAEVDNFETSELRTSAGVAVRWLTPIGALTFSLAKPLNAKRGDDQQSFQFNLGALF